MKKTDFFSIMNAVGISGIPQINTYNTLLTFLEQYGIFYNGVPKVEFVCKGYFTVEFIDVSSDNLFRTVEIINVSRTGLRFIEQLAKVIYQ